MTTTTELIATENLVPAVVFGGEGLDPVLKQITEATRSLVPDLTTVKGRKEIASMASKVARSKTYLDGLGKDLVADQKAKIKKVDEERKRMRDTLDELKVEVRKPLTEWENAEEQRKQIHRDNIAEIKALASLPQAPSGELRELLAKAEAIEISSKWEEFQAEAETALAAALSMLNQQLTARLDQEQKDAELEKLRKEAAEREQKAREEKIAAEAKQQAEREAQEQIDAERTARIRAEQEAQQAERRRQQDADAAAQQERQRIEHEKQQEELAKQAREQDEMHRAGINNAAALALIEHVQLPEEQARNVVKAIVRGLVPAVTINY